MNERPKSAAGSHKANATVSNYARKRGRVESADGQFGRTVYYASHGRVSRKRADSLPGRLPSMKQEDTDIVYFDDVNPRELRLAEVRMWHCPWMNQSFSAVHTIKKATTEIERRNNAQDVYRQTKDDVETDVESELLQTAKDLSLEEKIPSSRSSNSAVSKSYKPPSTSSSKRPKLHLQLDDMPTSQQAEARAQRAANHLIAKRDAVEKALQQGEAIDGDGTNATQKAMMAMRICSFGEGSDPGSPSDANRPSMGSAYSPNRGRLTTKTVAVSEGGISSPDMTELHLQEKLERVTEIGRGSSGVVYKAIHVPSLKVVAIKDVPVYGKGQRRQMVRELHALYTNLSPIVDNDASFNWGKRSGGKVVARPKPCPYVVSFYDAFVDRAKSSICLVMEYMNAGSLQDMVTRGGCQNEKIIARMAVGMLQGLAHIHDKNMIHRDIKPHNVLTNRQGEIKISDFGLARTLSEKTTKPRSFVGTLMYMAPERIAGGEYSYAADIWSCGLVLICVALGKYPLPTDEGFFGLVDSVENERRLELPEDHFSQDCRAFIAQCVRISPEDRPSAKMLLQHPFIHKYTEEETLHEWVCFTQEMNACEDRVEEMRSLADAVHRHLYDRSLALPSHPQSELDMTTSRTPSHLRPTDVTIEPVQMSLQLGLAKYLGLPPMLVYEEFEAKRCLYTDKLYEELNYSPMSWTPPVSAKRRPQHFSNEESPRSNEALESPSLWRRLRNNVSKIKEKHRQKRERGKNEKR